MIACSIICPVVTAAFASCSGRDKALTQKEIASHHASYLTYAALLEEQKKRTAAVESFLSSLSPQEQIAQLFLVNLLGDKDYAPLETVGDVCRYTKKNGPMKTPLIPGGYIFFSFNIAKTPEEISSYTSQIKQFCIEHDIVPPYLALDQEGGEVNRLRGITSTLPSNKRVAEILSAEEAFHLYELQARQLQCLGFNLNLAPVSEIETELNKAFLGGRSYGDYKNVVSYGAAAIKAYESAGIGTVLKHFPGNTNIDPHSGLPEIDLSAEELDEQIIKPFTMLQMYHPSAMLMSHARTKAYDEKTPACLSEYWVTDVVRNKMHFEGLVISDDIFMGALADNGYSPETAAVTAVDAGVDVIMLSTKLFAKEVARLEVKAEEDESFAKKLHDAEVKVIEYKIKCGILSIEGSSVKAVCGTSGSSFYRARDEGNRMYTAYFTGETK